MIEGGNVVHFQEQQEKEQQMAPVAEPPKIQFSRGELTGMGLAICLLGLGGRPVVADDGLYEQAMQLIAEGRYGEANAVLRRLVSAEPEHAGAWLDIAILQCSIGNAEEAEALKIELSRAWIRIPGIETRSVASSHL